MPWFFGCILFALAKSHYKYLPFQYRRLPGEKLKAILARLRKHRIDYVKIQLHDNPWIVEFNDVLGLKKWRIFLVYINQLQRNWHLAPAIRQCNIQCH